MDSDFNHQSKCLQTLEIPQDHDASSLNDVLSSMFHYWKITRKLYGGITDNPNNMVNAFRLLAIDYFPCVAHTLQLSIGRGLDVPIVQRAIGRCQKIGHTFQELYQGNIQATKGNAQATQTHAHTRACDMLRKHSDHARKADEAAAHIAAVLMDGRVRHLMPEAEKWSIIEALVDILKLFQQATEAMGAVEYPTLSTVKSLLYKLVNRTLAVKESDSEVADSKARNQKGRAETPQYPISRKDPQHCYIPGSQVQGTPLSR